MRRACHGPGSSGNACGYASFAAKAGTQSRAGLALLSPAEAYGRLSPRKGRLRPKPTLERCENEQIPIGHGAPSTRGSRRARDPN